MDYGLICQESLEKIKERQTNQQSIANTQKQSCVVETVCNSNV